VKFLLIGDSIFFKKNISKILKKKKIKFYNICDSEILKKEIYLKINKINPDLIFIVSGLSGGIQFNINNGEQIYNYNSKIYIHLYLILNKINCKNIFFHSSSCVYPSNKKILKANYYGQKPLEKTSICYSLSKLLFYNLTKNINNKFICNLVPATLYGNHYKKKVTEMHVLNAIIYKISLKSKLVKLFGSGKPMREFLHIDDYIDAILFLYKNKIRKKIINIGCQKDISISDLVDIIVKIKKFRGKILWDKSKSDGSMKKLLDSSYIFKLGWRPKISLKKGILSLK
jgi:GDP-L-fucose synthase